MSDLKTQVQEAIIEELSDVTSWCSRDEGPDLDVAASFATKAVLAVPEIVAGQKALRWVREFQDNLLKQMSEAEYRGLMGLPKWDVESQTTESKTPGGDG